MGSEQIGGTIVGGGRSAANYRGRGSNGGMESFQFEGRGPLVMDFDIAPVKPPLVSKDQPKPCACKVFDGLSIPTIHMSEEDKLRIRKPWVQSLIVKVVGKSFSFDYLIERLKCLLKTSGLVNGIDLGYCFFLIKFQDESDMLKVLSGGLWFVGSYFVMIRKWEPEFKPSKAEIETSVVIWARLPELPIEFYDSTILHKIGTKLGKLNSVDLNTENSERRRFARLCVQVDLYKPLVPMVKIGGFIQKVSYEGIPSVCFNCGVIGHRDKECSAAMEKDPPSTTENSSSLLASHEPQFGPWMIAQRKKSYGKGDQMCETNLNSSKVWRKKMRPISNSNTSLAPTDPSSPSATFVHPEPSLDINPHAISRDGGIEGSKIKTSGKVGCTTEICAMESGISITQHSVSGLHDPNLLPNSPGKCAFTVQRGVNVCGPLKRPFGDKSIQAVMDSSHSISNMNNMGLCKDKKGDPVLDSCVPESHNREGIVLSLKDKSKERQSNEALAVNEKVLENKDERGFPMRENFHFPPVNEVQSYQMVDVTDGVLIREQK